MMHGKQKKGGISLPTFTAEISWVGRISNKAKGESREKKNQTDNTREESVSENYSKENDGDENIPKEQSKP